MERRKRVDYTPRGVPVNHVFEEMLKTMCDVKVLVFSVLPTVEVALGHVIFSVVPVQDRFKSASISGTVFNKLDFLRVKTTN